VQLSTARVRAVLAQTNSQWPYGHGGALDAVAVVVVAVAAVEYGRVDGLRHLLDIRAVE